MYIYIYIYNIWVRVGRAVTVSAWCRQARNTLCARTHAPAIRAMMGLPHAASLALLDSVPRTRCFHFAAPHPARAQLPHRRHGDRLG